MLKSFYAKKKVLITGGASFIGSHLTELLVEAGSIVTVVDDLSSGKLAHLDAVRKKIRWIQGDLRDPHLAQKACTGQEMVFHLAAAHGGRGYIESHPVECMNNMVLDHTVFNAAAQAAVKKIVFASSACIYPTHLQSSHHERLQLKESDAGFDAPGKAYADGEYGWAKIMGELQLRAFHKQYGISGIACRIFTAYGERENESHAVVALVAKAVKKLDPYPIWGDGLQTRNFTYVKDTVMGLALAGQKLNGFDAINVGVAEHYTILELMDEIFAHLQWKPRQIKKELDKPVGVLSRASDNTKCLQNLGWQPQYSLKEGVQNTIDWYRKSADLPTNQDLEKLLFERKSA